ncbi:hypothetical protein CFO_g2667 [Ceratocystis platani]|uniref:Uncharacterized protein n=1 Tax=Ceratocystis fimbriata f. sp. platani TaxID=88771 RepID=A0A0F8B1D8_CERFI|nr:hypothetical protein CFO_g2667 [Ceratocystis platani]
MPDFTHWAELPAPPENTTITVDRVRQTLGDAAAPPFLARLIGFDTERKLNAVRYSVQRSQDALTDRTLTDSELAALAQYASQEGDSQITDHAMVIATALGLTLWGRKTMRFPLWRAPDMSMFNTFPSAGLPWLRGRRAQRAWHVARFATYYIGTSVTLGSFLGVLSTRAALTHKAIDPRLRDFLRESILDPQNQEILLMLQKERNVEPIQFRRQDDPWVIRAREIRRNRFYEEAEKSMTPAQREATEKRRHQAEKAEEEWRQRVGQAQRKETLPVNSPESVWAQRRSGVMPTSQLNQQVPQDADDDDPFALDGDDDQDASPVPAHIRRQEQQEREQRQQYEHQGWAQAQGQDGRANAQIQGSAWDRLREQAAQDSAAGAPGTGPAGSGGWNTDKQQDFDSLLKAERQGGQQANSKWQ